MESSWRQTDARLAEFVALHADGAKQRSSDWFEERKSRIGGSELAALLGSNPYSTFRDVVAEKAGLSSFAGNLACRWGTLFESAIERFVALDLGTELRGCDLCLPAPPGSGLRGLHANSPDGFCVVGVAAEPGAGARASLQTTAGGGTPGRAGGSPVAVLLEFKCPLRRRPKASVPRHYLPQVWSGLALAPVAQYGLFVDAVFRRCSLADLGPSAAYDREFLHREAVNPDWGAPVAWGFSAIFAPCAPAAPGLAASLAAAAGGVAGGSGSGAGAEPADFGDCPVETLEELFAALDAGELSAVHVGPYTPDGRGSPALGTDAGLGKAVAACAAAPPGGQQLLGVLPWKLLEVDYVFVERRPGFLADAAPCVHEALAAARAVRAAADPPAALRALPCRAPSAPSSGGGRCPAAEGAEREPPPAPGPRVCFAELFGFSDFTDAALPAGPGAGDAPPSFSR